MNLRQQIDASGKYFDLKKCALKKRYGSEKGARMAVEMNPAEAGNRYYECKRCLGWHTTSKPLWEQGRDRK